LGEALRRAACRARGIRSDDLADELVVTDLYASPSALVLGLTIVLGAAFAIGGREFGHRLFDGTHCFEHNDVAGFIIAFVGTLSSAAMRM